MTIDEPELIRASSISEAWSKLFLRAMKRGTTSLPLIVVSVAFDEAGTLPPRENTFVRRALDLTLKEIGKPSVAETANTIFPLTLWDLSGRVGISDFSRIYSEEFLPRYRARTRSRSYGSDTYFSRMISCEGIDRQGKLRHFNQLHHVVELWHRARAQMRSPRRSALQVSCLDPAKDQNGSPLSGFPCLQQLSITYEGNAIGVSAYYPGQYIVERAFGNFLGLAHLGVFMADQMGATFQRLSCFSAHAQLGGGLSKRSVQHLEPLASRYVQDYRLGNSNE